MNSQDTKWLLQEKYNGVQSAAFLRDCERITAGEPLDYVIGFSRFLGCTIDLLERPLIPRTETEWWVEKILDRLRRPTSQSRVLDMFAGSGCIGVALLKPLAGMRVDFIDVEAKCIRQVKKNCA